MAETKKAAVRTKATTKKAEDSFYLEQKKPEEPTGIVDDLYNEDWLEESYDGQLSIDVYQTEKEIMIKSTIAGVRPEDIDISINKDMVTIKGRRREDEAIPDENYLYRECYWGGFSRSIILPTEIKADKVRATLKNGILTVTLPKANHPKAQAIKVKEIEE
ncbi:MAG: Hsp20/alpha crystallin family protein [Patescibacteria group bacterium]